MIKRKYIGADTDILVGCVMRYLQRAKPNDRVYSVIKRRKFFQITEENLPLPIALAIEETVRIKNDLDDLLSLLAIFHDLENNSIFLKTSNASDELISIVTR